MTHATTSGLAAQLREQAASGCESSGIPGYVVGVHHGSEDAVVAHGVANVDTGASMGEDTGFLFGSVTKVLTTTLVLQQVERGAVDLDRPVVSYLPNFTLLPPSSPEEIRVRHLLSHTNGIDADLYFPDAAGRTALEIYLRGLGRHCGALFAPGELASYSNGGMIVAGRLLEVVTDTPYRDLLARDVYAPAGMRDSSTSAADAILRSTAVGHFPDPATMEPRRTDMFMLPDTWAPAGATPIGTVRDLIQFGRTHAAGGVSPSGTRMLASESAALMRTPSVDMKTPNLPPIGMGWLLMPFGETKVLTMSGAHRAASRSWSWHPSATSCSRRSATPHRR